MPLLVGLYLLHRPSLDQGTVAHPSTLAEPVVCNRAEAEAHPVKQPTVSGQTFITLTRVHQLAAPDLHAPIYPDSRPHDDTIWLPVHHKRSHNHQYDSMPHNLCLQNFRGRIDRNL